MSDKNEYSGGCLEVTIVLVGVAFVTLCVGMPIGSAIQKAWDQKAAIKAGVGEFVVNPETGESKFTYKQAARESGRIKIVSGGPICSRCGRALGDIIVATYKSDPPLEAPIIFCPFCGVRLHQSQSQSQEDD